MRLSNVLSSLNDDAIDLLARDSNQIRSGLIWTWGSFFLLCSLENETDRKKKVEKSRDEMKVEYQPTLEQWASKGRTRPFRNFALLLEGLTARHWRLQVGERHTFWWCLDKERLLVEPLKKVQEHIFQVSSFYYILKMFLKTQSYSVRKKGRKVPFYNITSEARYFSLS